MKKGQRKTRIPKDLHISSRPEVVNKREEFGHWECDLMVFKRGIKTNLITLRERKSRFMLAIKNPDRCANTTAMNIITVMKKFKKHVKSITFDQGIEFSKYQWIKDCVGTDIYFCDPASPHQKGAIENGNSMIRLEFKRDYEADKLKQHEIDKVIKGINNRPFKCLDYCTPSEIFQRTIESK